MLKIVAISDTHLDHPDMKDYWGDVIVHCGDCTNFGYLPEVESFLKWYSSLNYKYKILVPGNHDYFFEQYWEKAEDLCKDIGIVCLNDSGVEIEGIKFWGSPISLRYGRDAFVKEKGEGIQKHWDLIPNNINILITHGPPANVGDLSKVYKKTCVETGCEQLRSKVDQVKPKYHLFGHIHCGYGIYKSQHTTFINCVHLDKNQMASNPPVEFFI